MKKKVNMFGVTQITLSLTGRNSHKLELEPGTGEITIRTNGYSKGKYDILVDKGKTINWNAFNDFYVPATWEDRQFYPFGTWPRGFNYYGNDLGFIEWSKKRKIETFNFFPNKEMVIDLRNAKILFIYPQIEKTKTIYKIPYYKALKDTQEVTCI